MPTDPFDRMQSRVLAHLGKDAVFNGQPCRVGMDYGVGVTGDFGEVVAYKTFAGIPSGLSPKPGNQLIIGQEVWTVDKVLDNDGIETRVVLR